LQIRCTKTGRFALSHARVKKNLDETNADDLRDTPVIEADLPDSSRFRPIEATLG
jgi:hypothetical protein